MSEGRELEQSPFAPEDESEIIANFVNTDNEVVARRSGTNLPVPQIGSTVSFGTLSVPSMDAIGTDEAEFSLGQEIYDVLDVEYNYAETILDDEVEESGEVELTDDPSEFVLVTVYVEEITFDGEVDD